MLVVICNHDPLIWNFKENKGAGVGLLLVKGFVERNGGEICADSIEGHGTTIHFSQPSRQPEQESHTPNDYQFGNEA